MIVIVEVRYVMHALDPHLSAFLLFFPVAFRWRFCVVYIGIFVSVSWCVHLYGITSRLGWDYCLSLHLNLDMLSLVVL